MQTAVFDLHVRHPRQASPADRHALLSDLGGGLASMLVALPASLAFGVAVFAPFGAEAAAQGALAGALGAAAIGIVAPLLGGTERLISAPCAPAAAVMGGFALELTRTGNAPPRVILLLTLAALLAGILQVLYGALGGGTLIKYIPYPVVTGYLTGVGMVIALKQLPAALGWPYGTPPAVGVLSPSLWSLPALVVLLATIVATLGAPRVVRAIPAAIIGLAAGVGAYHVVGLVRPELRELGGNPLLVGPLGASTSALLVALRSRLDALPGLSLSDVALIVSPAVTLSVLLSIDTLKTCVVVDAVTRSRHDSNREVRGQGIANIVSALVGGIPGAGTSGATLVNVASGARTRRSGVFEGVAVLLTLFALGPLVAWTPLSALAGILLVVAARMIDWRSVRMLRQRSTVLDFVVVATVAVVAVSVGLVTASGVGVGLAILLFIRDQVRGTVIHRKTTGDRVFSRQRRLPDEMAILQREGHRTVVCELEGNLFFGTTDQLVRELAQDLRTCRVLILDLRRVRSVDLTASHLLEQMEAELRERGASLCFASVPRSLPTGEDLEGYFQEVGLVKAGSDVPVFRQLSDALQWAEDRTLAEAGCVHVSDPRPLALAGREVF